MADIRVSQLWPVMKTRLATARMTAVLYGANRIYFTTDDFGAAEGSESEPWGRVVIVPVVRSWDEIDVPGEMRRISFLIRSEANDFRASGYNVESSLEAAQEEAYHQLHGWKPTGFTRLVVVLPFYRWTPPQPVPMWDSERHLWFLSSEFRVELASPTA